VKSTCGQHRTLGYAWTWSSGRSTLTCRGCGAPDSVHETLREAVERAGREMYGEEL
jgi:hypothetical protein